MFLFLVASASAADPWTGPRSGYAMRSVPGGKHELHTSMSWKDASPHPHVTVFAVPAGLWVGEREVTQAQWALAMGRPAPRGPTPDPGNDGDALPVHHVTFWDVLLLANAMSVLDGLKPAYTVDAAAVNALAAHTATDVGEGGFGAWFSAQQELEARVRSGLKWIRDADGFRLPLEYEWEYAALAGGSTVWVGTSDPAGICAYGNVLEKTARAAGLGFLAGDEAACTDGVAMLAPVGSFRANAWGLHDLTGNVAEYTWGDWVWDDGPYTSVYRPEAPPDHFAARGGDFAHNPVFSRVRSAQVPAEDATAWVGVRFVRGPSAATQPPAPK